MKTLESTKKFIVTWCRNRGISVEEDYSCPQPRAYYDPRKGVRRIVLPVISSVNEGVWKRMAYHESCHLDEENLWHYNILKSINRKDETMYYVSSMVVDNLAERVRYSQYKGRARTLGLEKAKAAVEIMKGFDNVADLNNVGKIIVTLMRADCINREKWMMLFEVPQSYNKDGVTDEALKELLVLYSDPTLQDVQDSKLVSKAAKLMKDMCAILDKHFPSEKEEKGEGQGQGQSQDQDKGQSQDQNKGQSQDQNKGQSQSEELKEAVDKEYNVDFTKDGRASLDSLVQEYTKTHGNYYIPHTDQRVEYILPKNYNFGMVASVNKIIGSSYISRNIRRQLQVISKGSELHGTRRGQVSTRKLHDLFTSNGTQPKIFKKVEEGSIETDSAVSIMIDCSGSMGSHTGINSRKYETAAASVAVTSDVLTKLRITHGIYGFTEGRFFHQIYVFKNMGNTIVTSQNLVRSLCSYKIRFDHNTDGESLQWVAERLLSRPEKNKVIIVMSDGRPNGYYSGDGAFYLREVAKDIEENSPIHTAAIGIESSAVKDFYKNWEVINDIRDLELALLKVVRSKIVI